MRRFDPFRLQLWYNCRFFGLIHSDYNLWYNCRFFGLFHSDYNCGITAGSSVCSVNITTVDITWLPFCQVKYVFFVVYCKFTWLSNTQGLEINIQVSVSILIFPNCIIVCILDLSLGKYKIWGPVSNVGIYYNRTTSFITIHGSSYYHRAPTLIAINCS